MSRNFAARCRASTGASAVVASRTSIVSLMPQVSPEACIICSVELFLIVVIAVAAAPYVLGPVLVYRRQRQNPRPSFVSFDAGQHQLPQALAPPLPPNVARLERAGFPLVTDLFRMDRSPRMRGILL